MEYLKPELDILATAQEVILGAKVEGPEDGANDPPGWNKDSEVIGLDD